MRIQPGVPVVVRGGVWHGYTATFVAWAPRDRQTATRGLLRIATPAYISLPGYDAPILVPAVKVTKVTKGTQS